LSGVGSVFFDNFSNPDLARYYEIIPGIGTANRREGGLHYEILRAPDGPSDASDYLTIDSLGRPHSPTTKAVFRFSGTDWMLEACVEYDFPLMRNGRGAYLWLIPGDVRDGYDESIALVRYADLERSSHSLRLDVYDPENGCASIELARPPADRYWLRIARAGRRLLVLLSDEGRTFRRVDERTMRPEVKSHRLVMNSQSFAGGASFVLRALRLAGAEPDPASGKRAAFAIAGPEVSAVSADDILGAMHAGLDIDISGCAITGTLDLGSITSPITSDIKMVGCSLMGQFVATRPVSLTGAVSFLNCQFDGVNLSGVEFTGSIGMVGCRFTADTRFIGTEFDGGANFSGCIFSEKVFFRMARASKPVSLYYATFHKGADLSSALFDDLSLSDVAVPTGSVTLYRSEIRGTLRWMVTLQREPQPLGSEWELSATRIAYLVISAGERQNSGEYTGPALWIVDSNVYLRNANVDRLEFYNVHLAKDLDLSASTLRTLERNNATFTRVLGGWPPQSEYYSCFISYSAKDAEFAKRLYTRLCENRVTCWFAEHDIPIGGVLRQQIYDAIGEYDRFLLVLSKHSIRSGWVRDEVEKCFELEDRQKRDVLFPIRLDAEIESTNTAWAEKVRQQRNIGDFSQWGDPLAHERAFQRLLRDLKARA